MRDATSRFEILNDNIGEGAFGIVTKARDSKLNKTVALKFIRIEDEEEGIAGNTLREIALLKKLKHDNIIILYDVARVSSELTLVFELMDMDLKKFMKGETEGLDENSIV